MIDKVNHSNNINKKVAQLNKVFKLSLHIVCIQYLLGCCIFVIVSTFKKKSFLFHCPRICKLQAMCGSGSEFQIRIRIHTDTCKNKRNQRQRWKIEEKFSHSGTQLNLDLDPNWTKNLDPDPNSKNLDPQHCLEGLRTEKY